MSSSGHLFSPVVFDDIDFRFRPYDALAAYGRSKTAEVLLAVAWSGVGGRYFEDVNQAWVVEARPTQPGVPGVARYALDPANAERLWELASDIVR
ncbi:hypothetical protein ACWC9U_32225 [Streptomyces sp. 900116325]